MTISVSSGSVETDDATHIISRLKHALFQLEDEAKQKASLQAQVEGMHFKLKEAERQMQMLQVLCHATHICVRLCARNHVICQKRSAFQSTCVRATNDDAAP